MNVFKKLIDIIPVYLIYALALILPLIFTPFTTEFYETAKLIFLAAIVLLLLFFWGLKTFTENKISLTKTPLDLMLLLFLLVAFLATVFSPTPYVALFGLLPKVHGSLIFSVTVVLLYFMTVSNIKDLRNIRLISEILIFSGFILSLISLLSYFKIYLPWSGAASQNFSLAGSSGSAAAFLTILLPLSLSLVLSERNFKNPSLSTVTGIVSTLFFAITIILTGNLSLWIGAFLAVILTLFLHLRGERMQLHLGGVLSVIGVIVAIVAILAYTPTLKDKSPIGQYSSSFPREVQLPFIFSWKISAGAFRDSPILGTGPGTYLYNFTEYKPLEINRTDLWDKKISSAYNQYLQILAETGGAGLVLISLIAITFVFLAIKLRSKDGLGVAGITFFILMAFTPMTVLVETTGFLIIALFIGSLRERDSRIRLMEARLSTELGVHPLLPTIIFIPILSLIFTSGYFVGKLAMGEYYHRLALNSTSSNEAQNAYNQLIQAEKVNPQVDLYRVDLAQTNLALANGIASQKGPTESSPAGSLTDEDKRNIQQLLQQAIAEGRSAVVLSPRSAGNWEVLAQIYKQLSGVAQNATAFSLDAYGKAIRQDPLNPALRVAVGSVYYQAKNFDLAVRFFDDAVSLKPDYSNGLYNFAIALRDKGNTQDAIRIAERLVASLQDKPESVDYITASELLSTLKEQESQQPPQPETSALDKSSVPDIGLPKPENIATPPAVPR